MRLGEGEAGTRHPGSQLEVRVGHACGSRRIHYHHPTHFYTCFYTVNKPNQTALTKIHVVQGAGVGKASKTYTSLYYVSCTLFCKVMYFKSLADPSKHAA